MCWAACLSWWLKAVYKENHDQWDIDQDYAAFWDDGGDNLLSKAGIIDIVNGPWRMYWEEYASGPQFSIEELRRHLAEGPAYVGYYDPNVGSHHVNCIYAVKDASGSNPQIMVMEPAFKRNPADGTYWGKNLVRGLSYYQQGDVIIATPMNYGPKNSSGEF
jgi:hypothetical protein